MQHITVEARDPVEGLRTLAARQDESYQVFLWRAQHYLAEEFAKGSFATAKAKMEKAGAKRSREWGDYPGTDNHVIRYAIPLGQSLLKSKVANDEFLVEISENPKRKGLYVQAVLLVKFKSYFKTVAAHRDFSKGTVLDRVFGLLDLEARAEETLRLDQIEVTYGPIGSSFSSPVTEDGLHLDVAMTNTRPQGRLSEQSVYYYVTSELGPASPSHQSGAAAESTGDVIRDALVPGLFGDEHEHGYPDTFGSGGAGQSMRPTPENSQ